MQALSLICYTLVASFVVLLSLKLSDYVDLLDKKTNVSGAFLGGILLAAVTSLPELFTSLTSTLLLNQNRYVIGNILGSDLFNFVLFFIIFAIFAKKFVDAKVSKHHLLSLVFIAVLYSLTAIGGYVFNYKNILWGWFNPISIAILAVYAFSVYKTPKEEESEDKETDSPLTVKQIITRFIIASILLIGASIGVTYLTDWVVAEFSLGATFGGALFLGVATSLPELTATVNLSRKKNFNAAFGNILGSNVFNFLIITLADLVSFNAFKENGSVYYMDQSAFLLLVCGAFSIVVTTIAIVYFFKTKKKYPTFNLIFYIIAGVLLLASYIVFLVLSNINLGLSFSPMGV